MGTARGSESGPVERPVGRDGDPGAAGRVGGGGRAGSPAEGAAAGCLDLHELEAVKRLKYKYLRCLDQKRWEEIATCFTADATCSYSGGRYAFEGRDAIVGFLRNAMGAPSFHSSHRVHHPEIEFPTPATATGVWALEDVVIETRARITIRGAAFYRDEYVKQDGVWRIRSTGYERTYEEMESRADRPGLRLTASAWEKVE